MAKFETWWADTGLNLSHKNACIEAFGLGIGKTMAEIADIFSAEVLDSAWAETLNETQRKASYLMCQLGLKVADDVVDEAYESSLMRALKAMFPKG